MSYVSQDTIRDFGKEAVHSVRVQGSRDSESRHPVWTWTDQKDPIYVMFSPARVRLVETSAGTVSEFTGIGYVYQSVSEFDRLVFDGKTWEIRGEPQTRYEGDAVIYTEVNLLGVA